MSKIRKIFDGLLRRFHPNEVGGLEIYVQPDGAIDLHLLVLEKKKGELNFVKKAVFLPDFTSLKKHVLATTPLVLILNGKGILHKKLETLPEETAQIPSAILPNAKVGDFAFQVFPQTVGAWVSVARKEETEKWVNTIKELGYEVIDLYFGGFSSQAFQPMLEGNPSVVNTGYFNLLFSDDGTEVIQMSKNSMVQPENFFLVNEPLPNLLLTAGGAALQNLLLQPHAIYHCEGIETATEDFRYQNGFRQLGWGLLFFTFGILLLNFLAFSWLHNQTQEQQTQLAYHQTQLNQLDTLQRQLSEKQAFFGENKLLQASKVSFYGDEIGASLPVGIQLTELKIFPDRATQQQQREKLFLFDKERLIIKGNSQRSTLLNEWIKTLKSMEWIKEVKVLPYTESKGGVGEFELEVWLGK